MAKAPPQLDAIEVEEDRTESIYILYEAAGCQICCIRLRAETLNISRYLFGQMSYIMLV